MDASRPLLRIPRWVWDVAAALLVLLPTLVGLILMRAERVPLGWIAALIPVVLVLFRRRFPWAVLIGCAVCFGVALHAFPSTPGAPIATAIALYSLVVVSPRRAAMWTVAGTVLVLVLIVFTRGSAVLAQSVFQVVVTMGFAAALGDAVRTQRAYIAEIVQRAQRAEATRDAEASRRVAEDRLRIARDLHDAVAHQISVISLNAGVASSTLDSRPEVTREALATIRSASRTVLSEIGDLLGTLRLPGDQASAAPTVGLDGVADLVTSFAGSGLHTTIREEGELPPLSTAVDVVAYRVIQEALTNALKHGTEARAHVLLSRRDDELRIVVTNPFDPSGPREHAGYGLIGVRERVGSVRGTVRTENEGTTFRVEATIPLTADGLGPRAEASA